MLLKYIKIGTLVHTIWMLCVGIGNPSGTPFRCFAWVLTTPRKNKQKQKDYTEDEPCTAMWVSLYKAYTHLICTVPNRHHGRFHLPPCTKVIETSLK